MSRTVPSASQSRSSEEPQAAGSPAAGPWAGLRAALAERVVIGDGAMGPVRPGELDRSGAPPARRPAGALIARQPEARYFSA